MQAAILAAGLGTRLRPLTFTTPKALVPVLNRPLLGVVLAQVRASGARRVAVNTHHLAEQVEGFLKSRETPGMDLIIRHEPEILGTGGGLRSLGTALGGGPFLALNADILTDLDLAAIYRQHREDALATLVLHDCPPFNNVWLDERGLVAGIGSTPPGRAAGPPLAYTGVQVVGPEMLHRLPAAGPGDLVAAWRLALAEGKRLRALVISGSFWQDIGTPEAYLAAHRRLLEGASPALEKFFPPLSNPLLGEGAMVEEGAVLGEGVCLGEGVHISRGAHLENTVAWEGAWIAAGVSLANCIVGREVRVVNSARDAILA